MDSDIVFYLDCLCTTESLGLSVYSLKGWSLTGRTVTLQTAVYSCNKQSAGLVKQDDRSQHRRKKLPKICLIRCFFSRFLIKQVKTFFKKNSRGCSMQDSCT